MAIVALAGATPPAGPGVPTAEAAEVVSLVNRTDTRITLSITDTDGFSHYSVSGGAACSTFLGTAGDVTVDKTGLTPGTSYTFIVYKGTQTCSSTATQVGTLTVSTHPKSIAVSEIADDAAKLTISNQTAAWWYKRVAPSAGTCTPVGANTSSVTATGLTPGTKNRVTAYSASGCSAGTDFATSAEFTTMSLYVFRSDDESADIGLNGHSTAWWIKRTKPSAGTCASVAANAKAALTGLESGGTYEYRAYSAQNCPSANRLATLTFTTPTLTASTVADTSAVIAITGTAPSWTHKRTSPTPEGTCSSLIQAGTTEATVDSLDAGTTYTWKAYRDAACVSANYIGTVTFTTLDFEASGVTDGSATLTLAGSPFPSAWWHERATPSGGTCRSGSGATLRLSGLDAGTTYQWKAYGKSGCAAADRIATADFKTYQLAASSVTTNAASLAITNHTGNWWHRPSTGGTCTQETGTSASLSDLSPATSYRWHAYTAADCPSSARVATADFTTVGLRASTTKTGATLTIVGTGRTGDWWHRQKGNDNADDCAYVTGGATSDAITGLSPGTRYEWEAYDDASCIQIVASVAFTTQPAEPPPPPPPPTLTMSGPSAVSIAEGTTAVGEYSASPAAASWSLGGADAALFQVEGGTLSFIDAPDYENPLDGDAASPGDNVYVVTVRGHAGAATGTRTVRVTVTDVDEPDAPATDSTAPGDAGTGNAGDAATGATTPTPGFNPPPSADLDTLTIYTGSIADMEAAMLAVCPAGSTAWASYADASGAFAWVAYVTLAPFAAVNAAFEARFPDGLSSEPLFVTACTDARLAARAAAADEVADSG